jgi:release factor glutamine methyltransferase
VTGDATRAAALAGATARLAAAGVEDAARDARLILRWAAGMDAAALSARLSEPPGEGEAARFAAGVARRAARAPLSHVTGRRAFWRHDFAVTPDVLDPRPETELLVAAALERPFGRVLDLGVGSGCILLSLLAERPGARGVGIDASPAALAVAAANAAALGVADRADLRPGDWLDGVDGPFDLVTSNPPYLASAELRDLSPEVLAEPRGALDGGPDGLEPYRRIAMDLDRVLSPGGRALVEIGPTQGETAAAPFRAAGFGRVALRRDLDARPRLLEIMRD